VLPLAMTRSFFDDTVICCLLPVLWITSRSYFTQWSQWARINDTVIIEFAVLRQHDVRRRYVRSSSPDGGTGGEVAAYEYRVLDRTLEIDILI